MQQITTTHLVRNIQEVLDQLQEGPVEVTKHGRRVAVLVRCADLNTVEQSARLMLDAMTVIWEASNIRPMLVFQGGSSDGKGKLQEILPMIELDNDH